MPTPPVITTPDVTAGEVMDSAAALLNDTQKQIYTYIVQIPYLKIALKELREWFELSNSPVTDEVSTILNIPAGTTSIGFSPETPGAGPYLPNDLVEIQELWERNTNVEPFVPMVRKEFIPHYLEDEQTSRFQIWAWNNNAIELLGSS